MKLYLKKRLPLAAITSALILVLAAGCVDKSYDLDDVDWTLGSTVDLTLPTCSTGDIILKNVMNLKEDDVVRMVWDENLKDSIFCIVQNGDADIEPVNINTFRVTRPSIDPFTSVIKRSDLLKAQAKPRRASGRNRINVDVDRIEIPNASYQYIIKDGDAHQTFTDAKATGISTDVKSVERVGCEEVVLTLEVKTEGFPSYIPIMHIDNMSITLPRDLHVKACTLDGKNAVSIEEGKIQLTPAIDVEGRSTRSLTLKVTFDEITEGREFVFNPDEHTAELIGASSEVLGTFRIETSEMDQNAIKAIVKDWLEPMSEQDAEDFLENPDLTEIDGLIPTSVTIASTKTEFDKDIIVTRFTGLIEHPIGDIEPIKLDDMPDFLNDDDVILDLDNPIILFNAYNALPAQATTFMTMKSTVGGQTKVVNTAAINVDAEGTTLLYMADKPAATLPDDYKTARRQNVNGSISELIRKIPDQIEVEVQPVTLHADNISLNTDYEVSVHYEVFAPLQLGDKFLLVYRDSERGWAEDLDDIKNVNAGAIELKAKLESDLPADATLSIIPIDESGERIPQLIVNDVKAPAKTADANVTFTIKAANGYTINDALAGKNGVHKLDGMIYEARLNHPVGDKTLHQSAHIRLYDAKITLKGGITYDAN